jgi:glycosyltransferase involved in cell wall biosynthesis
MMIDVVIPTYNRSSLLARTLESLIAARRPESLRCRVIVVDNNSKDDTRSLVEAYIPRFDPGALLYVFEQKPGRSHALNAGIAASNADLVGMIDDDEEVDGAWLEEIGRAFADPALDFITGPCMPRWEIAPPAWVPQRSSGVIGWVYGGPEVRTFGQDYEGVLMGGNAVVRSAVLRRTRGYDPALGRTSDGRLLSCEDRGMQTELEALGARGQYRPGLVIHHWVPRDRLTKSYYRKWHFWHGVSNGVLERTTPSPVARLLGVPRYRVGMLVRDCAALLPGLLGIGRLKHPSERFDAWLNAVDLAGLWYGRYFFKSGAAGA